MKNSPAQGGLREKRGLSVRKCLLAVAVVSIMIVSCFVIIGGSQSSDADYVETDYSRYYYNQMSPLGKDIYDRWISMSPTGEPTATFEFDMDLSMLSTTSLSELSIVTEEINDASRMAIYAFTNERYDVYWLQNGLSWNWNYWYSGDEITRIHIVYTVSFVEEYPEMNLSRTEILNALNAVDVDETTRYSTVRSIHDQAVKILSYAAYTDDNDFTIRSIYRDIAGDHSVVCEGYAKLFKALCDIHDVPCLLISGYGNSEAHMWNIVQMEDGKWYGVDCTWDDQDTILPTYLLVGTSTEVFNDNTFGEDHYIGDRMPYLVTPELSTDAYELYHTVYFISQGTKVVTADVAHGGKVSVSPPTMDGFNFTYWTNNGVEFDLDTSVTTDLILVANWETVGSGSGTDSNIEWSLNLNTKTLTISGTGAMPDYANWNDAPWNDYKGYIRFVVIEDGVTSIGNYTFNDMPNLLSVSIPASVTGISNTAFDSTSRIAEVCVESGGLDIDPGSDDNGGIARYALVVRTGTDIGVETQDVPGGTLYISMTEATSMS